MLVSLWVGLLYNDNGLIANSCMKAALVVKRSALREEKLGAGSFGTTCKAGFFRHRRTRVEASSHPWQLTAHMLIMATVSERCEASSTVRNICL